MPFFDITNVHPLPHANVDARRNQGIPLRIKGFAKVSAELVAKDFIVQVSESGALSAYRVLAVVDDVRSGPALDVELIDLVELPR